MGVILSGGGGGGGGTTGSGVMPNVNGFRLTLATGFPVYAPQTITPSSTDTVGDTVTLASGHGLLTGTLCTVLVTGGNLTAGTQYYLNVSGNTVSFHLTAAAAFAGTSKVDLTASITTQILPSGITGTTLYFSPYTGGRIAIYSGSGNSWSYLDSNEISLPLGTLTSDKNYDVFVYGPSSVLTIDSLVAWTSDTARATDITRQNGIWVKSGDLTKRYAGTIRMNSTTTSIDDAAGYVPQVSGKRFVWNTDNQKDLPIRVAGPGADWTYNSTTIRQVNGNAGNQLEVVVGRNDAKIDIKLAFASNTSAGGDNWRCAFSEDSTTTMGNESFGSLASNIANASAYTLWEALTKQVPLGYHKYCLVERTQNGGTALTVYGLGASGNANLQKVGAFGVIEG